MGVSKSEALEIVCKHNKLIAEGDINSLLRTYFPDSFTKDDIEILYGDGHSNGFKELIGELIKFDTSQDINLNFIRFKSSANLKHSNTKSQNISLKYSVFYERILFDDHDKDSKLIFHNTTMNDITFENFTSTKSIEFHSCTFNGKVRFDNVIFEDYVSFKYNVYKEACDLNSTEFNNRVIFFNNDYRKGIDIETCIFHEDFPPLFNFSDVKLSATSATNRESAKRIKHFIEQKGDIIESNKWYAIEMEKYEKELSKDKKNKLFDWLVFKIHKYTSNHSQNFILAFLWICFIVSTNFIISASFQATTYEPNLLLIFFYIMTYPILLFAIDNAITPNASLHLYDLAFPLALATILATIFILVFGDNTDCNYEIFQKSINIFNTDLISESSNPIIMIYNVLIKAIMIFLSYQFIISIRQNTRRK